MQKMKWLCFKGQFSFFPHHIKRGKNYYSENGKAEVIMPDLMILIFYLQHTKTLYICR